MFMTYYSFGTTLRGYMEPLDSYLKDPSQTNPEYDYTDIFEGFGTDGIIWSRTRQPWLPRLKPDIPPFRTPQRYRYSIFRIGLARIFKYESSAPCNAVA